jgi:hypothetical protein
MPFFSKIKENLVFKGKLKNIWLEFKEKILSSIKGMTCGEIC